MKPIYSHLAAALGLTFAIAACVPAPRPAPAPAPEQVVIRPTPQPTPLTVPQPTYADWMDAPRSAGDWTYRAHSGGSTAQFGEPGAARFSMRCEAESNAVVLARASQATQPVPLRIRTETAERIVPAQPAGDAAVAIALTPRDPILDAMALTKGRFAIEAQGTQTLYLPAWAEVTRVIEDCR